MPRYAALLRGVNVGGKKKVSMAELRELLSGLGYTDIRTHLNSGNAVFYSVNTHPEELASQIENGIHDALGQSVRCLLRTGEELRATIAANPLNAVATDGAKMIALFLSDTPEPTLLVAHDPQTLAPEEISLGDRVIYQWCPNGVLEAPPVGQFVEKYLKVTVTGRNWNTVTRLSALLEE